MKTKIFRNHLYNFILPLIFLEWWYVMLALIFVVLIETYIVKLFIKEKFRRLLVLLFRANVITTLLGFLLQGIIRLIIGMIIYSTTDHDFEHYPVIEGILGNVGMGTRLDSAAISEIITSMIICLVLSVIIERSMIKKDLQETHKSTVITKSVLIANIISYLILTPWVFYNFYRTSQ